MFKVEIIPSTQSSSSSSQSQQSQHAPPEDGILPLHINLNTASHHTDGIILLVGRKNSDLTFPNEKSVSRSHCRLRLVRLNNDKEEEEDGNHAKNPMNESEKEACESAIDGLAIVIDDLGSKFGTKVFYNCLEDNATKTSQSNSKSDSETDDETDDENQNTQPNNAASLSKQITTPVPKNGSVVIPNLSIHRDHDDDDDDDNKQQQFVDLTAIIQCGTARFQITRIPLKCCLSRLSTLDKKKISSMCSSIGAEIVSTVDKSITHLITSEITSTAKAICAWTVSVPMVRPSFVTELYERKNMNESLPNVSDHIPTGNLPMDEMEYDEKLRRTFFKDIMVLTLMESETEMILSCAGATIKKLYLETDDKSNNMDLTFFQNDAWWENLIQETEQLGFKYICWLDCTSRKVKKGKEYLIQKMKEMPKINLKCIDQNGIVKAITSLTTTLTDVEGEELVLNKEKQITNESTNEANNEANDDNMNINETLMGGNLDVIDESIMEGQSELSNNHVDNDHEDENVDDITQISQKSYKIQSQQSNAGVWMSSSKSRSKSDKVVETIHEQAVGDDEEKTKAVKGQVSLSHSSQSEKKVALPVTMNGWLVAPKGSKRDKYKRDVAHIIGDELCVTEAAQTETCNLAARNLTNIPHSASVRNEPTASNEYNNTNNFKRFTKNSIIAGSKMHSISQIRFVSLLPKESERERELLASQQDQEHKQREADSLFVGDEATKKRGITSYFSPTSTSRSTRRRKG
mmetsp:Transcript_14021/g.16290  ORF Transcript_14021/g.16290 Transcript_14021/m.16290 type:complete len:747 (-) Transcript_14021:176-2416(-)